VRDLSAVTIDPDHQSGIAVQFGPLRLGATSGAERGEVHALDLISEAQGWAGSPALHLPRLLGGGPALAGEAGSGCADHRR